MTLLLVMLHTGTMFAVIVYFWRTWRSTYFRSASEFRSIAIRVMAATAATGVIGEAIIKLIEKTVLAGAPHAEIEDLFSHLELIAPALAVAGVLILIAGLRERGRRGGPALNGAANGGARAVPAADPDPDLRQAGLIGAVQGLCLPFRGFSRSGATISAGMLLGLTKMSAETFSFALAVVLTPPVVAREVWRLVRAEHAVGAAGLRDTALMSLVGAVIAFGAGLVALRWLSGWLERGRWYLFGIYCLAAAAAVYALHVAGY
jgi:undecaprenyl-diphosphatase